MAAGYAEAIVPRSQRDDLNFVRRINQALLSAWKKRVLPEPMLDADHLVDIAVRKERHDIEGGHWEEALKYLTNDLQRRARLNPLGRTIAHGLLARSLRQRIRADRVFRQSSEIGNKAIEKPVIILGHMRSGTTRLHRLLACDPSFSFTRFHESLQPLPKSRTEALVATSLIRRFMNACNPQLRHIHPVRSGAAEEEFGLHAVSLHGAMFEAQWSVPTFARWSEQRDLDPVYKEFRRLLQILLWRRREPEGRVQLLKAPQFMQDLDSVLREFPDARIIRLERNPSEVVASSASLVWHQQRLQSDDVEPLRIGAEWERKTQLREMRALSALAKVPSSRVITVRYEDTNRDWQKEVCRIYDFLAMPLDHSVLAKMARTLRASNHLRHVYSADRFGLQQ